MDNFFKNLFSLFADNSTVILSGVIGYAIAKLIMILYNRFFLGEVWPSKKLLLAYVSEMVKFFLAFFTAVGVTKLLIFLNNKL